MSRVSAIVVSYRVRELLRRCLRTVFEQRGVEVECWVVDNASDDGSADMVAAEFPEARLVRSAENLGFARANNLALARATGDVLALVNPDTELPPDAFARVAEAFGRHPRAGCVGLPLVGADGRPQPSCHRFPGIATSLLESSGLHRPLLRFGVGTPTVAPPPRGGEGVVDWIAGAFMALRREAYAEVGGLEPSLFLYGEEMDWSWRARARGWLTIHAGGAPVLHHGGSSGAGLRGPLFVRNLESRLAFLRRFRGRWRAGCAREIAVAGALARLVYWWLRDRAESLAGRRRQATRDQLERFGAVVRWRFSKGS